VPVWKNCTKCTSWLHTATHFNAKRWNSDGTISGVQSHCIVCQRRTTRRSRLLQPERWRAYRRRATASLTEEQRVAISKYRKHRRTRESRDVRVVHVQPFAEFVELVLKRELDEWQGIKHVSHVRRVAERWGVSEDRLYDIVNLRQKTVALDFVDRILLLEDRMLWELYPELYEK
jgi:hypothetical protein